MTDTKQNEELPLDEESEGQVDTQVTPGELLRAAREQAGLSVSQIADRLRLRRSQIEELEANEFSKYVGGTYIRGYLRSYAKLVNLNEASVIAAYQSFIGEEVPPGQMQSFSRKTKLESQDNKLMLITWIIILLLIGSVAVFVWQQFIEEQNGNGLSSSATTTSTQARERATSTTTPQRELERQRDPIDPRDRDDVIAPEETETLVEAPVEPVVVPEVSTETTESTTESESTVSESTSASTSQTPVSTQPPRQTSDVQSTRAEPAASPAGSEIPDAELVLTFADDCWVRIEDATGAVIAFGVKQAGHVMPLEGEAPFELTLGAPQAVSVYFRGESIDLSSYRGRTARFRLPAEG